MNNQNIDSMKSTLKEVLNENKLFIDHLKNTDNYYYAKRCQDCYWKMKEIDELKFTLKTKQDEVFDLKMENNKYKKKLLEQQDINISTNQPVGSYNGDQRLIDQLQYDLRRNKECYDNEINYFNTILKDKNEQVKKLLQERRPYDIMNDETNRYFWKNH